MGVWETISGKSVEAKIEEYSQVYGEIVLGLHGDLQEQASSLRAHQQRMDTLDGRLNLCDSRLMEQRRAIQDVRQQLASLRAELAAQNERLARLETRDETTASSIRTAVPATGSSVGLANRARSICRPGELAQKPLRGTAKPRPPRDRMAELLAAACIVFSLIALACGVLLWFLR